MTVDEFLSESQCIVTFGEIDGFGPEKAVKVVCGTEKLFPDPSPARPASTTTVGTQETEAHSRLNESRSIPNRRPAV